MKLSGWQRLWVVTSIVYLALVITIAAEDFPNARSVAHDSSIYDRLSSESIKAITASLDAQSVIREQMVNGHEIPFPSGTQSETIKMVAREYEGALAHQAAAERWPYIGSVALWWLVPIVVL
ncbi:MAG: hypothetical protein M3461_01435 [Pseudomonadota bacterium]|nr:hypothetical protein [Pseudomonadota bacterium]